MSLINQALKKEQQRRLHQVRDTTDLATPIHSFDGNRKRESDSRNLKILLALIGFGCFSLVLSGAVIYLGRAYLLNLQSNPPIAQTADAPSETTATFASGTISTVPPASLETSSTIDQGIPTNPAPPPTEIPIDPKSPDAIEGGLQQEGADPVESPSPAKKQLNSTFNLEYQDFVDALKVFGYRSAGENSRLLLEGRVYKLNDIVDHQRGLIFRGSDGDHLIFEDEDGNQYRKIL